MCSNSFGVRHFLTVSFSDLPLILSTTDTVIMLLRSTSNVTSIIGTSLVAAGEMVVKSITPRQLLLFVSRCSPSKIQIGLRMSVPGSVPRFTSVSSSNQNPPAKFFPTVKIFDSFVGMFELRLIIDVITPPAVSIPRDRGVTSSSSKSWTSSLLSPLRNAACTAAP